MSATRILYFGTYEKNFPRNTSIIRSLRQEGHQVTECHFPLLDHIQQKHSLVRSPLAILRLLWRLCLAYSVLLPKLCWHARRIDELWIGYIGHLDILVIYPLAKLLRLPIVFNPMISLADTLVSDRELLKKGSLFAKVLWCVDYMAFHAADSILIDTEGQRQFLVREFSVPSNRMRVVPLEAEEFFRPMDCTKNPEDEQYFTMLFFGKISPMHGLDTVLHAIKILQDAGHQNLQLKIAGDGQHVSALKELADHLELQNIQWLGWVAHDRLVTLVNQADLCLGIFGSSAKASRVIPYKVWGALACGKPVVTQKLNEHDTGSLPESVLQVEPTPAAIAEAITAFYQDATAKRTEASVS